MFVEVTAENHKFQNDSRDFYEIKYLESDPDEINGRFMLNLFDNFSPWLHGVIFFTSKALLGF